MKYANNNVLKGDFDRRKRESNAAQYIALKRFERAQDRGFKTEYWHNDQAGFLAQLRKELSNFDIWDGFMISVVVFIGVLGGLLITLISGA